MSLPQFMPNPDEGRRFILTNDGLNEKVKAASPRLGVAPIEKPKLD